MHIPRLFVTPDDLADATPVPAGESPPGAGVSAAGGVSSLDFRPGSSVKITNRGVCNQLSNVLRLTPGDKVVLLDGRGSACECAIDSINSRAVECTVLSCQRLPEESVRVSVAVAMLKGDRFDWALQKLTELGVSEIVPLMTMRTVVKLDLGDAKGCERKLSRWQSIVREAAEQSERATIPHVVKPKKLQAWVDEIVHSGARDTAFICAERMPQRHLRDILLPMHEKMQNGEGTAGKTIHLLVGPEGGFADEEIAYAEKQGIKPVSLGQRILRSETAAIYALGQVMWCLEK